MCRIRKWNLCVMLCPHRAGDREREGWEGKVGGREVGNRSLDILESPLNSEHCSLEKLACNI